MPQKDNINHPSHYETGRFECFDVMVEAIGVEETKRLIDYTDQIYLDFGADPKLEGVEHKDIINKIRYTS